MNHPRRADSSDPRKLDQQSKIPPRTILHGVIILILLAVVGVTVFPAFDGARRRPMPPCVRNLKMIGLALHHYHEDNGCFPPAFVTSPDGAPMHSWRVLIVPYLVELHEGDAIWLKAHRYDLGLLDSLDFRAREKVAQLKADQLKAVIADYDLTEPWNGPNNRRLSEQFLSAFCCDHGGARITTDYLAVTGPNTAWRADQQTRFRDILDGTSNTLLVVESYGADIHWSEPRDLQFGSMTFLVNDSSGVGIKGPMPDAASALMADGLVRTLFVKTDPAKVKAMLTIDGQE